MQSDDNNNTYLTPSVQIIIIIILHRQCKVGFVASTGCDRWMLSVFYDTCLSVRWQVIMAAISGALHH